MPAKPKSAAEIFGVRPQLWGGGLLAILALVLLYRSTPLKERREFEAPSRAASLPPTPASEGDFRGHPPGRESSSLAASGDFSADLPVVLHDAWANDPIHVLLNELRSPDPEVRMAAALRLSRQSVRASEALPVLKKLAHDEPDPKVREVMNEAILNIRGFVPGPFESAPKR